MCQTEQPTNQCAFKLARRILPTKQVIKKKIKTRIQHEAKIHFSEQGLTRVVLQVRQKSGDSNRESKLVKVVM